MLARCYGVANVWQQTIWASGHNSNVAQMSVGYMVCHQNVHTPVQMLICESVDVELGRDRQFSDKRVDHTYT